MISFQPRFTTPKFSGEVQQRVFTRMLQSFPDRSLARLNKIDSIPEHNPEHIRLAQRYGKVDTRIAALNELIIGIITQRQQAKREENEANLAEASEMLADLRVAINTVLTAFRENRKNPPPGV